MFSKIKLFYPQRCMQHMRLKKHTWMMSRSRPGKEGFAGRAAWSACCCRHAVRRQRAPASEIRLRARLMDASDRLPRRKTIDTVGSAGGEKGSEEKGEKGDVKRTGAGVARSIEDETSEGTAEGTVEGGVEGAIVASSCASERSACKSTRTLSAPNRDLFTRSTSTSPRRGCTCSSPTSMGLLGSSYLGWNAGDEINKIGMQRHLQDFGSGGDILRGSAS